MTSTPHRPTVRDPLLAAAREELDEKGHAAVSLRAVARRAGVSHAAPAHFFGDRAGMLTAVATDGFHQLAQALAAAEQTGGESPLAALGRAYVDFGLVHPALIDLMFRRSELTPDDPELTAAQRDALHPLQEAVGDASSGADAHAEGWSLVSWAFVHGLVTLVREGVLTAIAGRDADEAGDLARELVDLYANRVSGAA